MSVLTRKLVSMKSFKSRTPATEEQIKRAEDELCISFAQEYSEYLAKFGSASCYGHEFTGICTPAYLDVVGVTKQQREQNGDIPPDWYVVEELHVDGMTVWQDRKGNVYLKVPGNIPEKITNSLAEYIEL